MASGWSQPQPPAMMGNPFSPANPPSTGPQGFGAPQPPRFSAGSLISDNDLPEWLREGAAAGQQPWGAPQQAPAPLMPWQQPQQQMQAPRSQFPAPPPMPQQWAAPQAPQIPPPAPRPNDIASEFTVRQPAFGQPAPATPQAFPQQAFPQQRQPNFSQAAPAAPAYGQSPAFPPQQMPQQHPPYGQPAFPPSAPSQINAFPSLDQVGMGYGAAALGSPAGQPQLHQQPAPNWLAGGMAQQSVGQFQPRQPMPSGMQARSLIDDQQLPKWLRDQPEAAAPAARPSVADWMGAPGASQQAPQDMNALIAQAPNPVPLQPQVGGYGGVSTERGQARENVGIYHSGAANEPALPDWLRSQAGAASSPEAHAGSVGAAGGFAASDLIDPAALPEWVTGRAPAQQVFSSTHGWSSLSSDGGSTFGGTEQDYGAGFDTVNGKSIDAAISESAAMSAQLPWDEAGNPAPWNRVDAPDEMAYDEPPPQPRRGGQAEEGPFPRRNASRPLGQDELPPWLKGKAGGQAAQSNRDPWGQAEEQQGFDAGWNGGGQWDERSDQAEQVWDEHDAWDDGSAWDERGQGGQEQAWGADSRGAGRQMQNNRAPSGRRDEPAYANDGYGGYDDYDAEYSANGYDQSYDQSYDQRYDERSHGRPQERPQERGYARERYDYQEEPEPEQRGGWFGGFMKRGRR